MVCITFQELNSSSYLSGADCVQECVSWCTMQIQNSDGQVKIISFLCLAMLLLLLWAVFVKPKQKTDEGVGAE